MWYQIHNVLANHLLNCTSWQTVFPQFLYSVWVVRPNPFILKITPVYKENDRIDISEYRPFSLLKNVSKVFEKILLASMYPLIELRDEQYGFRQARSLLLQLVLFLVEIFNRIDNKECEEILTLFIDFRKIFDKVTHQKLMSKLGDMGIGRKLLKLLASLDNLSLKLPRSPVEYHRAQSLCL